MTDFSPILNFALAATPRHSTSVSAPMSTSTAKSKCTGPASTRSDAGGSPMRVARYPENPRATAEEESVVSRIMFHATLHAANSPNVTET